MMKAFHDDPNIKEKYLSRVKKHRELDHIVQGVMWEKGKGCAVGCTLEKYDHAAYEVELGIPEWLARLEDAFFEKMSKERAILWPEQFLDAIPLGVNLEKVKTPFIIMILEHTIKSMDACVYDKEKNPNVLNIIEGSKKAVIQMIHCHRNNLNKLAAVQAAWLAAVQSSTSSPNQLLTQSAAWSARSAEWSVTREVYDVVRAAATAALRLDAYEYYAEELLRMLKECR